MPNPIIWTDIMVKTLIRMRANHEPYLVCAERIGVAHTIIGRKCRELGINAKMNRGYLSGTEVKKVLDGKAPKFWLTKELVEKIRNRQGVSILRIAQKNGVRPYSARREARKLGITAP